MFTHPGEVNGTFVIDGVVGDYLCEQFGSLEDAPFTIEIKENRLVSAHLRQQDAARRVLALHAYR